MKVRGRPERGEAAEYYFKYIDLAPDGEICATLGSQLADTLELLSRVPPEKVDYRYAPGKWSIREVVNHINDTERLFTFRAFWFARGFDSALPSFDQEVALRHAAASAVPWEAHVEEFRAVRAATLSFFRHLPDEAWLRRGTASDNPFSVRALAWLAAGHAKHHSNILRERYLEERVPA